MDASMRDGEPLHTLELRVLEGPQAGGRAALVAGVSCVLAAEPDGPAEGADIVLREEQFAPARVRITAQDDLSPAALEVLQGEVRLGNQVLSAGTQTQWKIHAPLQIGRSVIAFGPADAGDWPATAHDAATERTSGRTAAPAAAAAAAEPSAAAAATAAARAGVPLRRRAEAWLVVMGAIVLLFTAGAFLLAHHAAAPASEEPSDPAPLATALRGSEFAALHATTLADGRVELRGRLGTLAERARLDAWLAERQFTPTVDVKVDEALARDVGEVFRVNGVPAQAQVAGPGRIVVEAAERDATRLARAEEVVRRDVRGLEKLVVHNTAVPLPPPAPPVVDDPGKRIASVVPASAPGQLAYLVTADGARYFVGAMLPTGHRITKIAQQRVTLERDGQQSTLNF